MRFLSPRAAVSAALVLAACSAHRKDFPAPIPRVAGEVHTAFALRYIDTATGSGALAQPRKCFYAHYTGWLTNGKKFDSSRDTMPNGHPRSPIHSRRAAGA